MIEKLTKELFKEKWYWSDRGPGMEEVWSRIEADREAVRAETQAEMLRDRYELGEYVQYRVGSGDDWRPGFIAIRLDDKAGWASGVDGVRRPPKTRPMTREELKFSVSTLKMEDLEDALTEEMARAILTRAGIPTEVPE